MTTFSKFLSVEFPKTWWSLTITKNKADIPQVWFTECRKTLDNLELIKRAMVSLERGNRNGHLHMQGVFEGHLDLEPKAVAGFVALFKAALGCVRGDAMKVTLKPFTASQSWRAMIGYCSKDNKLGHYEHYLKNISEDEIREGVKEYNKVKLDPMSGKIALTKANVFKEGYRYWFTLVVPQAAQREHAHRAAVHDPVR